MTRSPRLSRNAPKGTQQPASASEIRTLLYLRLSDARRENGSFEAREAKLSERADQLGWTVAGVVIENDVIKPGARRKSASAFKKRRIVLSDGTEQYRVWRPGFRSVLNDLAAGRAHALLAEDLDRAMRDPYDLEDLIDIVERYQCSAESLSGSLKFTRGGTDAEIMMARSWVNHANMESRDKARRVAAGRERKALAGLHGGGPRPFGWGPLLVDDHGHPVIDPRTDEQIRDYNALVPEEAEVVRWATDAVLGGVSLNACARELRDRGVPTVTGVPWSAKGIREILARPRNAGLVVYKGEIINEEARWPAILPRDTWDRLVALLDAPDRKAESGPAAKWLGSGIYRCGVCGGPLYVYNNPNQGRTISYFCAAKGSGHVRRQLAAVDEWVEAVVLKRLREPDLAGLLNDAKHGIDVGALRARAAELRQSRSDAYLDKTLGRCTPAEYMRAKAAIDKELDKIEATLSEAATDSLLGPLVAAEDTAAAWAALGLGARREVLRRLVKVTILPVGHRGGGRTAFDRDAVLIEDPDE